MNPSVLFVQSDSIYKTMGLNCYDSERNAFTYDLEHPVICHPPCRLFSRLRAFSTAPICEKLCAYFSILLVRKLGGVVEHPFPSLLFKELSLPSPGCYDRFGGFTLRVDQFSFGHKAKKPTLLYVCGLNPHYKIVLPTLLAVPTHVCGRSSSTISGKSKELTKRERSATPQAFAKFLVDLASNCSPVVDCTMKTPFTY